MVCPRRRNHGFLLMNFAKSMLAISLRQLGIVHDILIAAVSMTIAMSIAWGWQPLFSVWQIWLLIGAYTALRSEDVV